MNKNELLHYGVKGMKWGIRKKKESKKSLSAKRAKSNHRFIKYDKKALKKSINKAKKWLKENVHAVDDPEWFNRMNAQNQLHYQVQQDLWAAQNWAMTGFYGY